MNSLAKINRARRLLLWLGGATTEGLTEKDAKIYETRGVAVIGVFLITAFLLSVTLIGLVAHQSSGIAERLPAIGGGILLAALVANLDRQILMQSAKGLHLWALRLTLMLVVGVVQLAPLDILVFKGVIDRAQEEEIDRLARQGFSRDSASLVAGTKEQQEHFKREIDDRARSREAIGTGSACVAMASADTATLKRQIGLCQGVRLSIASQRRAVQRQIDSLEVQRSALAQKQQTALDSLRLFHAESARGTLRSDLISRVLVLQRVAANDMSVLVTEIMMWLFLALIVDLAPLLSKSQQQTSAALSDAHTEELEALRRHTEVSDARLAVALNDIKAAEQEQLARLESDARVASAADASIRFRADARKVGEQVSEVALSRLLNRQHRAHGSNGNGNHS